jgi:hypothetical protein
LTSREAGGIKERLPGGEGRNRQGRRFLVAESGRFFSHLRDWRKGVFGIAATALGHNSEHRLSDPEIFGSGAEPFGLTREIEADEGWKRDFAQASFADLPIRRIDAGGMNAHQEFPRFCRWFWRVFEAKNIWSTERVDANGFHGCLFCRDYWHKSTPEVIKICLRGTRP